MDQWFCLLGIACLYAMAWLISTNRQRMNWRLIGIGTGVMLLFGFFVFRSDTGKQFFIQFNAVFNVLLGAAARGQEFVFGELAKGEKLGFILAFQGLPQIFFFSALIAVLYHYRILPRLIGLFARFFGRLLGTSGAESLCAASNIFVGVESGIAIRPYLQTMTRSELCTIMTVAMATVSSNVMGLYCYILKDSMPMIAGHLLSASFLSAPAALVISKILYPETDSPTTLGQHVQPHYDREPTVFSAIITGANSGLQMVMGIAALLVAVVGLVSVINLLIGTGGEWINAPLWMRSIEGFFGKVFYYFFALIGFDTIDSQGLSTLMGTRLVSTEVTAYEMLNSMLSQPIDPLSARAGVVGAYALCGFAHFPSIAIFTAGFAAIAPERTHDLASVAMRALLGATLACLITGCVAGIFYTEPTALMETMQTTSMH